MQQKNTIIWCMLTHIRSATDLGHFIALLAHYWPHKLKFGKTEKNSWRYYHFKHEYHKWKSYGVWFLRYGAQQTEFFLILDHFLHFYTSLRNNPEMQNEKNTWRYHHFTQVYHKWQSHDIWFLRYEVHQTEFFCHLGPFFKKLQKKLYGPFLWMGFNCLKACATLRRQFTLYH